MVSILEPISSRNRQQRNDIKYNEVFVLKRTISSVCESIEGLAFTTEGYQRAKSILQTKYGKTSEIVASYYVQHIMVFGKNLLKVREFYEKLVTHVEAMPIVQYNFNVIIWTLQGLRRTYTKVRKLLTCYKTHHAKVDKD